MSSKDLTFTVSARGKLDYLTMDKFLNMYQSVIGDGCISSVYGFSTFSPLYGGRSFATPDLKESDIDYLADNDIGFRIPLTSSIFTEDSYERTKPLLDKHHNKLNSIICTNDMLAKRIREDYSEYKIEASVIKNIKLSKISENLDIYDSVVLPMKTNDDIDGLVGIEEKDRIILFANAGCAYNCPSKVCYQTISRKHNQTGRRSDLMCSEGIVPRENLGLVADVGSKAFDLEMLSGLGFKNFKVIPL